MKVNASAITQPSPRIHSSPSRIPLESCAEASQNSDTNRYRSRFPGLSQRHSRVGNLERNCRHSILSTRASQTRRPGASCPISQKGWIRLCLIRKSRSVAAFGLSRSPWWTPRTRSSSLAKRIVSVVRAFSIAFGRGGSVREMVANASQSGLVIPPSSMSGVHSRNLNLCFRYEMVTAFAITLAE